MELSFSDLKKKEVINVADARSLGFVTDITLSFPSGKISGITVPGKPLNCITKLFNKTEMFIPSAKIIKIGNDVVLVNVSCGFGFENGVETNKKNYPKKPCPPNILCPPFPPCEPPFNKPPKNCSPPFSPCDGYESFADGGTEDEDY